MAFIPPRSNPNQPIPNDPFYSPETSYFVGPYYNASIEPTSGIDIDLVGTINVTGGGGAGTVTAVTGALPVVVANPTTTPVISINAASTAAAGVVQLSDSVSSGSSTTAASSLAVQTAYNLAAAALPLSGGTMTGPITFAAGQIIPINTLPVATTSSLGIVQIGTNINVSAGTISVANASTSAAGAVQLNDTVASTSTTQALTAAQGKALQDQIDALTVAGNLVLAGTIDASTGNLVTVTADGTAAGFAAGSPLPAAAAGNTDYFAIVTIPGTMTPPGGSAQVCHQGDWWLSNGTTWSFLDVGFNASYATTTTPGIVTLSTDAATQTGTDATLAVTPTSLQSKVSDSTATTSSTAIASSTAVKTAYDLAAAAIPKSTLTAKGDLISSTAASTPSILSVGTDGQVLTACAACTTGLAWAAGGGGGASVPCAAYTAKGDILGGTAAGTFSALPLGTAGQLLSVNTACSTGLEWITSSSSSIPCACVTAKGSLITGTAASTPTALAVGTDGQFLVADSTCTTGLKWAAGGGGGGSNATPTAAGIVLGCTTATLTALGCNVGAAGTENTFIGVNAAKVSTTSTGNTVIGKDAGLDLTTSFRNTLVGVNAGCALTSNGDNVLLGANAGCGGPGSANVFIGAFSGQNAPASHNTSILIGTGAGRAIATAPGSQIIIGTNSGTANQVSTNIIIGHNLTPNLTLNCAIIGRNAGSCASFNLSSGTGWTFTSDSRVKDGITALPVGGEAFINALRPVAYCFLNRETKEPLDYQHCNVGFIAQEVERALMDNGLEHISNLVGPPVDDDSYYSLTETSMLPFLVKAFQELSAKVTALEAKLAEQG